VPKMKTHRGAAKRLRPRKGGSVRRGKSRRTHILSAMSSKRKMHLRKPGEVHKSDMSRVKRMLPN
jgi:large subunit ribosomal protein L35